MEEELAKEGKSYRVNYAKDEVYIPLPSYESLTRTSITNISHYEIQMKKLVRAYFQEAYWFHNDYVPTVDEYMKVSLVSGGYMMLATTSMVGMGDSATKEDFDWVTNEPLIVRAALVICRLMDDMVGHEV